MPLWGRIPSLAFIHFKVAAHLWNVHRLAGAHFLSLEELRKLHRYYTCPIGPVAHNFSCRFRFVPRRSPVHRSPASR